MRPAREGTSGVSFWESGIAATILLALSPLLLALTAWVKLVSPGPALFVSERVGKDGTVFRLFKLRTMVRGAPQRLTSDLRTVVAEDDCRYILGGVFLRKGFDELFQLLNIARREMRFVGPRPDLGWMRDKYLPAAWPRLSVAPGITGWAQVHGSRWDLSTRERYLLDLWYVAHRNWRLDLKIAAWTPLYLFLGWKPPKEEATKSLAEMAEVGPLFIGENPSGGPL